MNMRPDIPAEVPPENRFELVIVADGVVTTTEPDAPSEPDDQDEDR